MEITAEALWKALKAKNCSRPETAVRIVMLSEESFMQIFKSLKEGKTNEQENKSKESFENDSEAIASLDKSNPK